MKNKRSNSAGGRGKERNRRKERGLESNIKGREREAGNKKILPRRLNLIEKSLPKVLAYLMGLTFDEGV